MMLSLCCCWKVFNETARACAAAALREQLTRSLSFNDKNFGCIVKLARVTTIAMSHVVICMETKQCRARGYGHNKQIWAGVFCKCFKYTLTISKMRRKSDLMVSDFLYSCGLGSDLQLAIILSHVVCKKHDGANNFLEWPVQRRDVTANFKGSKQCSTQQLKSDQAYLIKNTKGKFLMSCNKL